MVNKQFNMKYLLIFSFLCISIFCEAQSSSAYASFYNNFAQLHHPNAYIEGKSLQLENKENTRIVMLDSTGIDSFTPYKYYIHYANLHNKEGKSYKVTDGKHKSHTINSTECGLVFNHTNDSYWMITTRCTNSNLYDESVDKRSMTIDLSLVNNGKVKVIESKNIEDGVNLSDEFNYLCAQVDENAVIISIGKDKLEELLTHNFTSQEKQMLYGKQTIKVGIVVGPGSLISIERTVLSTSKINNSNYSLETPWTREALDRHFAQTKNPYEGYWTYLDRDMEDTWLKLGGRYTIALVETPQGYDVIYVDGAQVKKSSWHSGMKKGQMTKTIFTDNFNGIWYDATQEAISQDVYATFESGVILSFKFPVYKSQVRFSKILNNE